MRSIVALRVGSILIVCALLCSMFFWGIENVSTTSRQSETVVRVGKTQIGYEEAVALLNQMLFSYERMLQHPLDAQMIKSYALDKTWVSTLLVRALILDEAKRLGFIVPDEALKAILVKDQNFLDAHGQFSSERLSAFLERVQMRESIFLDLMKGDILFRQVLAPVDDVAPLPEFMQEGLHTLYSIRQNVSYTRIPLESVQLAENPSSSDLEALYRREPERFRRPELRTFALVELNPEALYSKVKISDSEIRDYYASHIAQYHQPEKREVHQLVFKTKDEAEEAYRKISEHKATFESIASSRHMTAQDTTLGLVNKNEIYDPAVAEVAFSLQRDAVSAPVKNSFGYSLLNIVSIVPESNAPLERVKPQLVKALKQAHAEAMIENLYQSIEDQRLNGAKLKELAEKEHIPYKTFTFDTNTMVERASEALTDALPRQVILQKVFSSDVDTDLSPLRTANNGYLWIDMLDIKPSMVPSFEALQKELKNLWKLQQKTKIITQNLEERIHRVSSLGDFLKIVQEFNVDAKDVKVAMLTYAHPDSMFNARERDAIDQVAAGHVGFLTDEHSILVFYVRDIITSKEKQEDTEQTVTKAYLAELKKTFVNTYLLHLNQKQSNYVNRRAVNQALEKYS